MAARWKHEKQSLPGSCCLFLGVNDRPAPWNRETRGMADIQDLYIEGRSTKGWLHGILPGTRIIAELSFTGGKNAVSYDRLR